MIYPRTAKVTCTCGLGVDVHPIYWSDALALGGMVAELRNWSHRSICRLRSLRGGTWVAKSRGPVGRWRGQAQPRESGSRRAPTGVSTMTASLEAAEGGLCRSRAMESSGRQGCTRAADVDEADPNGSTLGFCSGASWCHFRASRTWQLDVLVSLPAIRYMSSEKAGKQARPDGQRRREGLEWWAVCLFGALGQGRFDALACMTGYARGGPTASTSSSPQA